MVMELPLKFNHFKDLIEIQDKEPLRPQDSFPKRVPDSVFTTHFEVECTILQGKI